VPLRVFAFGDLAGTAWGAAWVPSEPGPALLLGALGESGPATSARLDGEQASEPWHLSAEGTELTLEGLGQPVPSPEAGRGTGFDQLCQVTGVIGSETGQRDIQSLGWRGGRSEPLTSGRLESLRQVAAWFEPEDGFGLLAVRPEGGRGQERDQITAALFSPAGPKVVADPRLSTTYDGSGQPTRASVELWIDSEGDSETQYPRRATGQAVAEPRQGRAGALALEARPFRWYGGLEGAGVYLIGRAA